MVDVFRKTKFELLDLTETKLKGNGEVSWWGVNGIMASVQEMERARKVGHPVERCVVQCSSKLWICFQGLRFVWWCGKALVKGMVKKGTGSGKT